MLKASTSSPGGRPCTNQGCRTMPAIPIRCMGSGLKILASRSWHSGEIGLSGGNSYWAAQQQQQVSIGG